MSIIRCDIISIFFVMHHHSFILLLRHIFMITHFVLSHVRKKNNQCSFNSAISCVCMYLHHMTMFKYRPNLMYKHTSMHVGEHKPKVHSHV